MLSVLRATCCWRERQMPCAVLDPYDGAMDRTLVISLLLRLCLRIVVRIAFVFP